MVERTTIEVGTSESLLGQAARLLGEGYRLALVAAHHDDKDHPTGEAIRIVYLFTAGPPDRRVELVWRTDALVATVPSLFALSFPASRFEREMRDLYGVQPEGHGALRPLVHHPRWPADWHPMRHDAGPRPAFDGHAPFPFVTVEGDGVYEIPVGPVHAGLIEPGHFRFSVVGETVLKLKARLWYVHKGIELLAQGRDVATNLPLAERVSGDTAVGHALAYSLAVEEAAGVAVPADAARARAVLLELERLHNHVADLGMLCNDVAFGIANAHAQRIRERLLRLNKAVTGHRLLRGGVFPGGAALAAVPDLGTLDAVARDVAELARIALKHTVVRERFTGTAVLRREQALDVGALGYVARASGVDVDARVAHPFVELGEAFAPVVRTSGDVLARFEVRAEEARRSVEVLRALVPTLREGRYGSPVDGRVPGQRSGVGIVEGWRGTIVHRVELAEVVKRWKIVDPSFFNWPALPLAMADTIVPDFPLANKSFNLSYAGNDL
jgi:Ni,Fe-hydrogenase III large subunit/Ni,Fe-hydrogenase III component G